MADKWELAIDDITPGLLLGADLFDEFGIVLCREGEPLTNSLVMELRQGGIKKVTVKKAKMADIDITQPAIDHFAEFDHHVDKCLSMVMHHDEVQQISGIIKKVNRSRAQSSDMGLKN
jgi:hypothetical protein